jgi:hypothetical protein
LQDLPKGFSELVPDIIVEVVSGWDTPSEIQAKIREWIEAEVRLVLYVYPDSRTVHAIRSLTDRRELTVADVLDLNDVSRASPAGSPIFSTDVEARPDKGLGGRPSRSYWMRRSSARSAPQSPSS